MINPPYFLSGAFSNDYNEEQKPTHSSLIGPKNISSLIGGLKSTVGPCPQPALLDAPWEPQLSSSSRVEMDEVMTAADATSGSATASSSPSTAEIPANLALISAFLACAVAQFLKLFTSWSV